MKKKKEKRKKLGKVKKSESLKQKRADKINESVNMIWAESTKNAGIFCLCWFLLAAWNSEKTVGRRRGKCK